MTSYGVTASVRDYVTSETGTAVGAFNVASTPPPVPLCQLGIYDPANDYPSSWSGMQAFAAVPVRIATYYVQWGGGFPINLASLALAHNVTPFVELEPWYTSTTWPTFSTIAAGASDAYLQTMAKAVNTFGHPVMMTYAHEMNGSWYPWGKGGAQGVTAAQWVASWQHVVSTMNAVTNLITWVWAPNNNDVGSVAPYWPGQPYVGLAAYDGYLQNTSQTFANFQASTVAEIRKLTTGPIWNSECGVEPAGSGRAALITKFIADLKAGGVSGFNWFNQSPFNLTSAEMAVFDTAVNLWNA
jgi:mannan endo-1,4-beta-mannosidase